MIGKKWEEKDSYMQLLCFFSDNNSCVRKSVFLQNPYPDVQFAEDQIWMRARLEDGYKKAYCDDAAVFHSHNYKGKDLSQRYFDDLKGMHSIHGYQIVDRKKNIPKEFLKSFRSDISYIRSIPIQRNKKIPLVFEALSRNSKKYTSGYLGGTYHLQNSKRQKWLDKHFSQQKRKKEE